MATKAGGKGKVGRATGRRSAAAGGTSAEAPASLPRHRLFALEYLECLNATEAYRRVYPASRNPDVDGPALLGTPGIQAIVAPALAARERRLAITVERADQELIDMLDGFDPAKLYDEEGRLLPVRDVPREMRRLLTGVEQDALFETVVVGEGPRGGEKKERLQVGVTTKLKWSPYRDTVRLLHERLGTLRASLRLEDEDGKQLPVSITIGGLRPPGGKA